MNNLFATCGPSANALSGLMAHYGESDDSEGEEEEDFTPPSSEAPPPPLPPEDSGSPVQLPPEPGKGTLSVYLFDYGIEQQNMVVGEKNLDPRKILISGDFLLFLCHCLKKKKIVL